MTVQSTYLKNLRLDFWRSLIFSLWSVTHIILATKGLYDLFTHVDICNSFAVYLQMEISEFTLEGFVLFLLRKVKTILLKMKIA